jgi:hypothetical protein
MEIDTKILFWNKVSNFFTFNINAKIKGYCGDCRRPVYNLNSKYSKKGFCMACYHLTELQKKILRE